MTGQLPAHFVAKFEVQEDGCWLWIASRSAAGYGLLTLNGKRVYAHRTAYQALVGAIPLGLMLDHLCRNRACCNPEHLEPVTNAVNSQRGDRANKTTCKSGKHPWPQSAVSNPGTRGMRCVLCQREGAKRRYYEQRDSA